jgi:hypothetical protein
LYFKSLIKIWKHNEYHISLDKKTNFFPQQQKNNEIRSCEVSQLYKLCFQHKQWQTI